MSLALSMGRRVAELRRQAGARRLHRLAAVCTVLTVALVACAGGGDGSGSDVGSGSDLGSGFENGSGSDVGSEAEAPPTPDLGPAEDRQRLEDEGQAKNDGLPEDGQRVEGEAQPEDELRAIDEAQPKDGQRVEGEPQAQAEKEQQSEDGRRVEGEPQAQAEKEQQPQDGQRVEGEGQAEAENEQQSEDGQRVEGEGQAEAENEQQSEDGLRVEGEAPAEAENEQQSEDGQWAEDEDAELDSGEGGVVEQTARMVEGSGGEVVFVHHPGRGDRTVLGLPVAFVDGETPLIVSLHGYAGDSVYHSAFVPLHERVNAAGFALLLPNALPDGVGHPAWNPTDRCCDGGKAGEDDVAYLTELVAEAMSSRNFGPVYFFGYSNGGFMAYHMACKALDGLRAVASLAGTSYLEDSNCDGAPPVSVLHIHGTADNVILYGGDETDPDPESDGERTFYASAEDMVTRWSHRAGCDWPEQAQPHARLDLDQSVPGPETRVFRPESGCAEGVSIELWAGVDSGHGPSYGDAFMDALLDWLLLQT